MFTDCLLYCHICYIKALLRCLSDSNFIYSTFRNVPSPINWRDYSPQFIKECNGLQQGARAKNMHSNSKNQLLTHFLCHNNPGFPSFVSSLHPLKYFDIFPTHTLTEQLNYMKAHVHLFVCQWSTLICAAVVPSSR